MEQLAGHLGLDTFYVLGNSSGGPYSLACAYALPDRVQAAGASCSVAPMGRPGALRGLPPVNLLLAASARWFPPLTSLLRRQMQRMIQGGVEEALKKAMPSLPETDKEALYEPANLRVVAQSLQEGYRQGWQGIAHDDSLVNRDWGFDPADIAVHVEIWHGTEDVNVPFHAAEYLHRVIPDSRLTPVDGAGHFFLIGRWREVLTGLVGSENRK
jgi:pimeloyl-ACP methyl ester carboxylesterase